MQIPDFRALQHQRLAHMAMSFCIRFDASTILRYALPRRLTQRTPRHTSWPGAGCMSYPKGLSYVWISRQLAPWLRRPCTLCLLPAVTGYRQRLSYAGRITWYVSLREAGSGISFSSQ